MLRELILKTPKELNNLKQYQEEQQKIEKEKEAQQKLEQEEGYFDNFLEEIGQEETQHFEMPKGTKRKHFKSKSRNHLDNSIEEQAKIENPFNLWTEQDVKKLHEYIKQVGLDPVLLEIVMPEKTQRSIRKRLREEDPELLLRLASEFKDLPEDVKITYMRIKGEVEELPDIANEISESEVNSNKEKEKEEVAELFEDFIL